MKTFMSEYSKDPSVQDSRSSVESGGPNKTTYVEVLGGYPPKKDVEAIDRQNSPAGRKRAPGSVRV